MYIYICILCFASRSKHQLRAPSGDIMLRALPVQLVYSPPAPDGPATRLQLIAAPPPPPSPRTWVSNDGLKRLRWMKVGCEVRGRRYMSTILVPHRGPHGVLNAITVDPVEARLAIGVGSTASAGAWGRSPRRCCRQSRITLISHRNL